jgi:hypothetical protein
VRGGRREANGHHEREETPEEVKTQGSLEPFAGTSRRSCDGLPGRARPCSRARGAAEAAHRRANGKRARAHREVCSLLAKEKAPKGKTPRACAARNKAVEVVAEAKRREGQRTLRAQRSGEANPGTWAAAIASADGVRTPWEAAAPARAQRPGPVTLWRGDQGQESSKPETSNLTGGSLFGRTAKIACGQGQGGRRETNDPHTERTQNSEGRSNLMRGALEAREGSGGTGQGKDSEGETRRFARPDTEI